MKTYLDITVVISPGTKGAYAVRVESSQGGQGHSTLKLPFTLRDLSGAVFGVAQTTRDIWIVTAKEGCGAEGAKTSRSAADFGVELFEALFQGETRDVLAPPTAGPRAAWTPASVSGCRWTCRALGWRKWPACRGN